MARIFRPRYRYEVTHKALRLRHFRAGADSSVALTASSIEAASEVSSPGLDHPPRVWLNTTQTKAGATEMTVTAWSATSITFTDPAGSPTGSLQLGVENTETGEIGWIGVTVNASGADHVLNAADIESASEVSAPSVGQVHDLAAADLESASEVTTPAVGQIHDLTAADLESSAEVSTPTVSEAGHSLLAEDLESSAEVTAPSIGQAHSLSASSIESAAEVTTPAVGGSQTILAEDLESSAEVTTPAVGQNHALTAVSLESASEVTTPAPGQFHYLAAADVESAAECSSPQIRIVGLNENAIVLEAARQPSVAVAAPVPVLLEAYREVAVSEAPRRVRVLAAERERNVFTDSGEA